MISMTVELAKSYDIFVGGGLLPQCGRFCREINGGERAVIVSDSNVFPIYGKTVGDSLKSAGYAVDSFMFEAGEPRKRLETVTDIYHTLAKNSIGRGDIIVALGGGVTGDMAGFAAATWMRGIQYIQIPTSLLAQVDSSVGGKTGVDIADGKNLVGAFWQPSRVIADTGTLSTLPAETLTDGMAEVIKTAAIRDAELFKLLEQKSSPNDEIIARCIDIKRGVVQRDERESGERRLLNFGHTLGHALEKFYGYTSMSHGRGVAIGMAAVTRVSEARTLTAAGTSARLEALLKRCGLPAKDTANAEKLTKSFGLDKKRESHILPLILLREIGDAFVYPVDFNGEWPWAIAAAV